MMEPICFGTWTCVVVRCNYCGNLYTFYPARVRWLGKCKCGNNEWGTPRKWSERMFGDFSYLWHGDEFLDVFGGLLGGI